MYKRQQKLIPNYYLNDKTQLDNSRLPKSNENRIPIVQNISKTYKISNGLSNRNILLWHSHGWYYNNSEKRWICLLYTSPSPRDRTRSRMPSSA